MYEFTLVCVQAGMCVYMCMVYMYMYVYKCVGLCVREYEVCVCLYVCGLVSVFVSLNVCEHVYVLVRVCVCVYMSASVCVCTA